MMKIRVPRAGIVRCLGLLAVAILALSAASSQRAEALSLMSPAGVSVAKHNSDGLTTEVRGGRGGGGRGGGFHGGGFHGGGYHGGGFHAVRGGGFHGGGFHRGFVRHGGFAFHHRFHRGFYYAPSYYDYPRCRVIWTAYGPRRICHYRHWRHHHWHHRHWRHHYRYW
jgi:hypothetical protein